MTEGDSITAIEKLLDALTDDEARKRVLEWARAKYERKAAPKLAAPTGLLDPLRLTEIQRLLDEKAKEMREQPVKGLRTADWPLPFTIETNQQPCAFDNLPPGVYGLVCSCPKCRVFCTVTTDHGKSLDLIGEFAKTWTDADRARFTQGDTVNTVDFRGIQTTWFGNTTGCAVVPSDIVFRS